MPSWTPLVVIALALLAAACVGFIAWELTSKRFHDSLEGTSDPRDSE